MKTSSSRTRKSSPLRSSTTARMTGIMLKHRVRQRRGSKGAERSSPSYIIVWWGVSYQGVTPLHFCEKGVKTGARVYQEDVLQEVVKPLNPTLFNGQKWIFQQDSAAAHKAKTTQEWLRRHVPAFISAKDWPSGSLDLNPLYYKLWAVLEDMACRKRHNNLDCLKRYLMKAA